VSTFERFVTFIFEDCHVPKLSSSSSGRVNLPQPGIAKSSISEIHERRIKIVLQNFENFERGGLVYLGSRGVVVAGYLVAGLMKFL